MALPPNKGQNWASNVVYTPLETLFLEAARAAGVEILKSYELFLFQGIDAFRIFTEREIEEVPLRRLIVCR